MHEPRKDPSLALTYSREGHQLADQQHPTRALHLFRNLRTKVRSLTLPLCPSDETFESNTFTVRAVAILSNAVGKRSICPVFSNMVLAPPCNVANGHRANNQYSRHCSQLGGPGLQVRMAALFPDNFYGAAYCPPIFHHVPLP